MNPASLESAFLAVLTRRGIPLPRRCPGFQRKAEGPLPRAVAAARKHMQATGWSYRAAAPVLGISYQHLAQVLTGRRQSRSLLARIERLPQRPTEPATR